MIQPKRSSAWPQGPTRRSGPEVRVSLPSRGVGVTTPAPALCRHPRIEGVRFAGLDSHRFRSRCTSPPGRVGRDPLVARPEERAGEGLGAVARAVVGEDALDVGDAVRCEPGAGPRPAAFDQPPPALNRQRRVAMCHWCSPATALPPAGTVVFDGGRRTPTCLPRCSPGSSARSMRARAWSA